MAAPHLQDSDGPAFEVALVPDRETVTVAPAGELDLATVPALSAELERLCAAGFGRIRLDLRRLTFIDGTGLRCVLALVQAGGERVTVVPGAPGIRRVFEMACIDGLVPWERGSVRGSGWTRA